MLDAPVRGGSAVSQSEDDAVAEARVAVSENSVVACDQKGEASFPEVHALYSTKYVSPCKLRRRPDSFKKSAKYLLKECTSFAASFACIF